MTTLVGISGSLRQNSLNRKLVAEAGRVFAADRFVTADIDWPLYNGDVEDRAFPAPVIALAQTIRTADAVVISTPEYNKSLSGVLKNALDWLSRVTPGGVWRDKPVAIMSATGGRAGGERAQFALRLCLNPFRPRVLPGPELLVGSAEAEFDAEGRLSARYLKVLEELMAELRRAC